MIRKKHRNRIRIEDETGLCREEGYGCLRSCLRAALKSAGFPAHIEVFIVTDADIHEVNRERRGVDKPTDVLSFPAVDWRGGEKPVPDPGTGRVFLGDILISAERAAVQAEEYGHSLNREMGFLGIHGVLHLLGYDHETEADRAQMRAREEAVLERRGLKR